MIAVFVYFVHVADHDLILLRLLVDLLAVLAFGVG